MPSIYTSICLPRGGEATQPTKNSCLKHVEKKKRRKASLWKRKENCHFVMHPIAKAHLRVAYSQKGVDEKERERKQKKERECWKDSCDLYSAPAGRK